MPQAVADTRRELAKRQDATDTEPILDKYPVKTDADGNVIALLVDPFPDTAKHEGTG